jgi:RNA polymerase sigma factor (sigma-70 family)
MHPILTRLQGLLGRRPQDAELDGVLLERFIRQRDEAAFAELVQRHGPLVFGVCRRVLRDHAAAADAFQVTFLTLACKACSLRDGQALSGWLYRVALRVARRARVAAARRREQERRVAALTRPDPTAEVDWRELEPILDEELDRLPGACRAVVVLCCLEGLTHEQAARALGCPVGSISKRVARGRELLGRRLARRGFPVPAAAAAALLGGQATAAAPADLARATCRAALGVAAGRTAAGAVSARVASLLRETLRAMLVERVKLVGGLLLALGLLGTAFGLGLYRAAVPERPPNETSAKYVGNEPPGVERAPAGRDLFGDPLPPGARARIGTVRLRHGDCVQTFAVSGDGKVLASLGWDEADNRRDATICLWDTLTGRELGRFPAREIVASEPLYGIAPDGRTLVYGVDRALALSPDGKVLAYSGKQNRRIHLWSTSSARELCRLELPAPAPQTGTPVFTLSGKPPDPFTIYPTPVLAFAADGKTVAASANDFTIRLWDVGTGRESGRLLLPGNRLAKGLACSPDARILAAALDDGTIGVWRTSAGGQVHHLPGGASGPRCLAFSPDGKALASGHAEGVRLWDMASGGERHRLRGHGSPVTSVAFSADGRAVISAHRDGQCRVWDAATGRLRHGFEAVRRELVQDSAYQSALGGFADAPLKCPDAALSADGSLLARLTPPNSVVLWDVASGRPRHAWGNGSLVNSRLVRDAAGVIGGQDNFTFSPDGKRLASMCTDGRIRLWDTHTGKELRRFDGQGGLLARLTFSPDGGTLISLGQDGVRRWDASTGKESGHSFGPQTGAYALSPDGRTFAGVSTPLHNGPSHPRADGIVYLWDLSTAKLVGTLRGRPRELFQALAFSPDGRRLAAVGEASQISVWDVPSRRRLRRLGPPHADGVTHTAAKAPRWRACRVAFRGDGRALAAAYCLPAFSPPPPLVRVVVWDLDTGARHRPFPEIPDKTRFAAFSPDLTAVALTDGSNAVRVWDLGAGRERHRLTGHRGRIQHVAFSPDGKALASGSLDMTILVWGLTAPGG